MTVMLPAGTGGKVVFSTGSSGVRALSMDRRANEIINLPFTRERISLRRIWKALVSSGSLEKQDFKGLRTSNALCRCSRLLGFLQRIRCMQYILKLLNHAKHNIATTNIRMEGCAKYWILYETNQATFGMRRTAQHAFQFWLANFKQVKLLLLQAKKELEAQ